MSAPQQTFGTSYSVRAIHIFLNKTLHPIVAKYVSQNYRNPSVSITDYGHPVRKSSSLHGRKSTLTPKFLGTAEAYFACHIGPHRPTFSDFFDLCLHWVSVVRVFLYRIHAWDRMSYWTINFPFGFCRMAACLILSRFLSLKIWKPICKGI